MDLTNSVQSSLKGHSLWVTLYIFGFVSNKRQNGRTELVQIFYPRTILICLPQFGNSLLKTDKSANMFIIFGKQCCPFRNIKGIVSVISSDLHSKKTIPDLQHNPLNLNLIKNVEDISRGVYFCEFQRCFL